MQAMNYLRHVMRECDAEYDKANNNLLENERL